MQTIQCITVQYPVFRLNNRSACLGNEVVINNWYIEQNLPAASAKPGKRVLFWLSEILCPLALNTLRGDMEIRDNLKYTEDHEWVLIDGNSITLGITDYAQDSLSDIVYVELPEVGTIVESGETVGNIESVKAVAELYSPVSGEVSEVNKELEDQPDLVNTDPYDDGWMLKIQLEPGGFDEDSLMNEEEYEEYIGKLKNK